MRFHDEDQATELTPLNADLKAKPRCGSISRDLIFPGLMLLHGSIGVAFFTLSRGWTVLDSIYFVMLTLSTVGYGDMTPQTQGEKLFTTFYVLVGFCLLGYGLGKLATVVTRREEATFSEHLRQASRIMLNTLTLYESTYSARLVLTQHSHGCKQQTDFVLT